METIIENKQILLQRFNQIRNSTTNICKPLLPEDYVVQPVTDVSPPKWHLGHTTWFFEEFILKKYVKTYKEFNKYFNYVFNSYYETAGIRILRSNRGNLSRPDTETIYKYRSYVDERIDELFSNNNRIDKEILNLFEIGLHHEQQHQELLITDIKYILGHNPLFPELLTKNQNASNGFTIPNADFVDISEGIYEIGDTGKNFSYDNESPRHKVYLKPFRIMNRLVTNGEFVEFMHDNGYKNHSYWLSDGWSWVNEHKITAPLYWHRIDNKWYHYTLRGLQPVDNNKPLSHISYFEADAFAHYKGCRLPSEAEWEVGFDYLFKKDDHYNLFDGEITEPKLPEDNSSQVLGDVWEWTGSAYLPYPGYQKPAGAIGEYNGKFMIDQMVLRGGSCATPKSHIRKTYRNFFQTNKRWQFTGIRLASD